MTILILSENPNETAKFLDDKSLCKMIRNISQVLCNVHYSEMIAKGIGMALYEDQVKHIPLWDHFHKTRKKYSEWSDWAKECKGNYLYLVELGLNCYKEWLDRYKLKDKGHEEWIKSNGFIVNKSYEAIIWARDNVPDLKSCTNKEKRCTPECRKSSCFWDIEHQPVSLIMPKKYHARWLVANNYKTEQYDNGLIQSYRNYYQAKLKPRI